jgi:hypothetical protein
MSIDKTLRVGDEVVLVQNGHLNIAFVGLHTFINGEWHNPFDKEPGSWDIGMYSVAGGDLAAETSITADCVQLVRPRLINDNPEYSERVRYWQELLLS